MVNRFLLWCGAGAVCASVTLGMLAAGAGAAYAQTDPDGDGATTTSQSTNNVATQRDSSRDDTRRNWRHKRDGAEAKTDTPAADGAKDADAAKDAEDGADVAATAGGADDVTEHDSVLQATDRPTGRNAARPEAGRRSADLINDVVAAVTHKPDRRVAVDKTPQTDAVDTPDPVDGGPVDAVDTVEAAVAAVVGDPVTPIAERIVPAAAPTPPLSTLALAAPAQPLATTAQPFNVPPVISAIGTLVFGLISLAESVLEGPPMALPGSGVTVKRSTLVIGDQEVPADWYFPEGSLDEGGTPPEHVIYLQHGFLATGVFYDYTASYLAQQTNSVVVVPTLTSNIFATDGMWLGGTQMHQAVAALFLNGNTALQDSAEAAGYPAGVALPKDVVLVGHSLGGGLVIDTARYIAADTPSADDYHLAGVLMLDGVSSTDPVPILEGIPADIPVYNLSSQPYMWNLFGAMDNALTQVRGDTFHGVQLVGGLHSDSMIGGNVLVQFGAYLLTGFSKPSNVAGSQILAATWISDMFACQYDSGCSKTGYYGQPGDTLTIPTPFGPARALVAPTPTAADTLARELTAVLIGLLANVNFATDVPAASQTGVLA